MAKVKINSACSNDRSITFCVTGKSGLGHLRRTANIAAAIKRTRPDVELGIVANAPIDGLSREERALFAQTRIVERREMARCVAGLPEGPVVSDTAVIPDLELLSRRLILILRETIDTRLPAFRMPGGRTWDETLIAAPQLQWTVDPAAINSARVENVGWIYRSPTKSHARVLPVRRNNEKLILVATGGGGTSSTAAALNADLDTLLARVCLLSREKPRILQVLGPRAPVDARLANADEVIDVGSRLDEAFAEADLVVSTTGYNSVLELAATDTPTLLCAIARTYDDQAARAAAWAERLGLDHRPDQPERSALWITGALDAGRRRPAVGLGLCGSDLAAERLLAHIRLPLTTDAAFTKQCRSESSHTKCSMALRTCALFERGVPTPVGSMAAASNSITFARLEGPTALQEWTAIAAEWHRPEVRRRFAVQILAPLVTLHRTRRDGLDLPWLDPWRRVRPRFDTSSAASRALGLEQMRAIRLIAAQLAAIELPVSQKLGLVHGDFHLGQLIRPRNRVDFVLVDLDDLALGPPEADVANCAAYIATSPQLNAGAIQRGALDLLDLLGDGYELALGARLEPNLLYWHSAVALLRRALKLAERNGAANSAVETIAAAAQFTIDAAHSRLLAIDQPIGTPLASVPDRMGAQP